MASKYVDTSCNIQVIGNVYNNPNLLDFTDKYIITDEDFTEKLHRIIFGAIYKLHESGSNKITLTTIEDFLISRPNSYGIYEAQKGAEWLQEAIKIASPDTFDYYYKRMKKMSLLRAYDSFGIDVSDIYDPDNILDVKKKQLQEEALDNKSLEDLANIVDERIDKIRANYVENNDTEAYQAGEGITDLIDRLKQYPEVGIPLYGSLINTVTRGARLKKFYLRSAPSGVGKSRSMVADMCYIGCNRIYDDSFGWIKTGPARPSLYITTEQELEEIQTMMLAFLSNVDEDHILNGKYEGDEEERIREAARIISESPIYIEVLPDFSLQDVEDRIKRNIRDHDVEYVGFDYIHTSLKILGEISQRSAGIKIREDNVLFMLSARLKDLANKYGVFILSSTQLNGQYQESETPDQNLLRGSKAIADRIDLGMILLPVVSKDIEALEPILSTNAFDAPNIKMSIYKNRRGKYKSIYLWCNAKLGVCRINPMFATDYNYELININDLKITFEEEAF